MGRNPSPIPEQQPSLNLGIEPPALDPEVLPSSRKRKRGAINRGFKWLQTRIRESGEDIATVLLADMANHEPYAVRLCLEYGWGLPRKMETPVDLPQTASAADLHAFILGLLSRTASGEIPPESGEHLMRMAYIALQASEVGTAGPSAIESQDGRALLTEKLLRAIELRKQITDGTKNESAQADNAA
jgi:hypothetical protein